MTDDLDSAQSRTFRRSHGAAALAVLLVLTAGTAAQSVTAAGAATTASTPALGKPKKARIVADTGFRPPYNGFAFENYTGTDAKRRAVANLSVAEMRRLFGDVVCADLAAGKCDLVPEATAWMNSTNSGMSGGHCYGMSVASLLLAKKRLSTGPFGGGGTSRLRLEGNARLQRQIAYNWAFQKAPLVLDRLVTGTPNQILDKLISTLKANYPEMWTIAFFKRNGKGGHAVTPYAVRDIGGGKFEILVYDNNLPKLTRSILVNRKNNSWSYYATTSPGIQEARYDGDARTKSLRLDPVTPGLSVQPSAFGDVLHPAGRFARSKPHPTEVYLDTRSKEHGHLLLTDDAGRHTGYLKGVYVNQIPGAKVRPLILGPGADAEPEYVVPGGVHVKITVDGGSLKAPGDATVGMIGDGFDVEVKDINLRPGDHQTIDAAANGSKLSYTHTGAQSPTITVGASYPNDYYTFTAKGTIKGSGTLTAELPVEADTFSLQESEPGSEGTFTVTTEREDARGVRTHENPAVTLKPGDRATLDFASWDNGGEMPSFSVKHCP